MTWTRYDVTPCPKPRMTQRDKWAQRPSVLRYRTFKDEVRLAGIKLPEHAHVVFVLPMPESWPKEKRGLYRGASHAGKPDKDNLEKALLDSLFDDDSHIWDARVTKVWGDSGAIYVRELDPPVLPQMEGA